MNAIKYFASAAVLTLALGAVSCKDDDGGDPEVKNKIYLTVVDGTTDIPVNYADEITINVDLSQNAKADVAFTFAVTGDHAEAMEILDNPVTVTAGSRAASFRVKTTDVELEAPVTLTVALASVPTGYEMASAAIFNVTPHSSLAELTAEQRALISSINEAKGFDLGQWIGNIALQGTIEFPGSGARAPFIEAATIQLGGTTAITLGDEATVETPTLTMAANPMGMRDYLYDSFRKLTVDDKEYFAYDEDPEAAPESLRLMSLLGWNSTSAETFEVSLPDIKIVNYDAATQTADLEFVVEGDDYVLDKNGNHIYNSLIEDDWYIDHESWIPFAYNYSAWNRNLDKIAANDPDAIELMTYSITANPKSYLGMNSVNEDYWEVEDNNLYVAPTGKIDFAKGIMTFEFPFDHADQYGYSRVKVTYTLAK